MHIKVGQKQMSFLRYIKVLSAVIKQSPNGSKNYLNIFLIFKKFTEIQ